MSRIILNNFPARPLYVTRGGDVTACIIKAAARAAIERTPTLPVIPPKPFTPERGGNGNQPSIQ